MTTVSVAVGSHSFGGREHGATCHDAPAALWELKNGRKYRVVFTDKKPRSLAKVYAFTRSRYNYNYVRVVGGTARLRTAHYENPLYLLIDTRIVLGRAFHTRDHSFGDYEVPAKGWVWCEEA